MAAYLDFYLGCSSPSGFFGFWKELQAPNGPQLYLIKSGPGSGKSTLMKALAGRGEGFVERIHCSSDPDSLDGVYFPAQNAMLLDATAPHTVEPLYPGAREDVISLYHTFNTALLKENSGEICRLFGQCSALQKQAGRYYAGAGSLLLENARAAACATNYPKVRTFAQRTAQRLFARPGSGTGAESLRLLSAFTPKGIHVFRDTVSALASAVWVFQDEYGTASRVILENLRQAALARRYDIITCRCAAGFDGKIDHILVPQLGLALLTSNSWHPMHFEGQKNIRCARFCDSAALAAQARRMRFVRRSAAGLMAQGFALQQQALACHNALEAHYRAAVDFSQVDAARETLAQKLGLSGPPAL
ncbi:MAG: hypothetical protein IIV90_04595 [Oscillospiraceae bacterium]|nr:hypothetical protein [Oscillospiraceae bacterium]